MLTVNTILKATRQMTSFGERGTAGALDHLPAKVEGPRGQTGVGRARRAKVDGDRKPVRRWDDELKVFVHI